MSFNVLNPKITVNHLVLLVIIYIRQSSDRQVIEHTASADYQHSFVDLARHYGWTDDLIVVIDQDQGITGTDIAQREGFKWMRQQIFEGRVGAVICSEVSRLARDLSAFSQLIKLCAVYNTLLIDEWGVYDPNNDNDRSTLNNLGATSESEGRRISKRVIATKLIKAKKGELRVLPATGYIYNNKGKLILDTNKKVQDTIRLFFSTFEKLGTVHQVVKYFNRNDIKIPKYKHGPGENREIIWVKLTLCRALDMLHNPTFAGTFAYGRSRIIRQMLSADTTEQKKRYIKVSWDDDDVVLIYDHHKGYITWEVFLQNQQRIKDNRFSFNIGSSGAIRNGPALLQGRIKCLKCRRSMRTQYSIGKRKSQTGYICDSKHRELGENVCKYVSAQMLDKIVADKLLEALSPAQVEMSLCALKEADENLKSDDQRYLDALRHARAELHDAKIRFESIDPQNRNVAKEYEKILEEKMVIVQRLESQRSMAMKAKPRRLQNNLIKSLLALPQVVRDVWECEAVTYEERKRVLRCLIKEVYIKRREDSIYLDITIHWVTGAVTTATAIDGRRHQPEAVELMRRLAPDHTVVEIVERLNQAGFKSARAEKFNKKLVYYALSSYGIKIVCRERMEGFDRARGDGRYSARAAAKLLNVNHGTVVQWAKRGILDGIQDTPRGPYWIALRTEQISALKKP